ncbi:Glycosyl hydrolase family 25 [Capnocytophaga canis]|uniref:Glycosyl hydrolase family 25 n=1 Tax=Capnocytophaga canis TaxID=1848903 RepID=A0A0B7I8B7_9FLAO|nr:GH25 family lysozyme [Capnocytophaga canis]CEN42610.1 Glycosyl hydrolase family 25 [Capnocytophaga canis]CEN46297.1 Glycosyl hydrolase family 25 [Capnocytophaga canis]
MRKRKRQHTAKKRKEFSWNKFLVVFILFFSLLIGGFLYVRKYYPAHYQRILNKVFLSKTNIDYENKRIERISYNYRTKTFGIDLSHYQERNDIVWDSLYLERGNIPLKFAIFRATMGNNTRDKNFHYFWEQARKQKLVRGAYHFYRPDEDPVQQATSYLQTITLEKGDFLPILDIEKLPKKKKVKQYLQDIQVWLDIVEKKYGRKPIIYTYISFYNDYLHDKFKNYPLWIANYNNVLTPTHIHNWKMWQFTENGITPGSKVKIDLNIYNGSEEQMQELLIQK